eukprot:6371462-Pyramimonas_sp.AAC.1
MSSRITIGIFMGPVLRAEGRAECRLQGAAPDPRECPREPLLQRRLRLRGHEARALRVWRSRWGLGAGFVRGSECPRGRDQNPGPRGP